MDTAALLKALHWRYAVKVFDAERTIPADTWAALEEVLILSASSYGLQPWKFLVITSPQLRAELRPSLGISLRSQTAPIWWYF